MIIVEFIVFLILTAFVYSIFEGMFKMSMNQIALSVMLSMGTSYIFFVTLNVKLADNINWLAVFLWTVAMLVFYAISEYLSDSLDTEIKTVETVCLITSIGLFVCLF